MNNRVIKNKSSLGQNFILDKNLILSLLDYCDICKEDTVLEIGAGLGTLTEPLAQRVKKLVSIEIDKTLFPYLDLIQSQYKNIELINIDFLKWDMEGYFSNTQNIKVIANIPYYITSEIYHKLIFSKLNFLEINCMVQLEVANKIVATNKEKSSYGILSLLCQHKYTASIEKIVPKEHFSPIPKVDSAFVKLKLKQDYKYDTEFDKKYYCLIKSAFLHRRKTLVNSLKSSGYDPNQITNALQELEIKQNVRAEELDYNTYIKLVELL